MGTQRLYHHDAYLRRFDAVVAEVTVHDGKPAVVLDRTAFYPEAGGQLGDRGKLAVANAAGVVDVVDTQERDDGAIVHIVASPVTGEAAETIPIGARVAGELDWQRRRQHMVQHTAQHLLSGTLLDRAAAPTASARLGESALTIDVARDRVPEPELVAAETLANDLIDEDVEVRAWFPTPDELARIKLRRDPKVTADIRVVAIGEFDYSPCGGTHASRTSQLVAVRITAAERYKGMTRVTFAAGRRGRADLFARDHVLRALAAQFSCGPAEVPAAIDKLRRDADAAAADVTALRGRLAGLLAATFEGGRGPVVATLPGDAELARGVAAKLVGAGRDALLAVVDDGGTTVVLFRTAGSTLDCGALWKKLAAAHGGRGGGRADRAEGRLAVAVADWPAALAAVAPELA